MSKVMVDAEQMKRIDQHAIARMLYLKGKNVEIRLFGQREKASEETSAQLDIAEKVGLNIRMPDETENLAEYTLIVDALFGIGLNCKIEGAVFELIQSINQTSSKIIAVDCVSGLPAEFG